MKHVKIAIIGAGAVGSTTAYALMLRNIAAEIMLVDINDLRCQGELLDLSDTLPFCASSNIHIGTAQEARDADIIIFSAGISQKPGQTRLDLLTKNKEVVAAAFASLQPINPQAIIIMVTNPNDILTYQAQQLSGLPRNQLFGTGTFMDSLRLRGAIAQKLQVAQESIHAYVLAEHGDTQFAAWSCAMVAGIPLRSLPGITQKDLDSFEKQTHQKAYDIISCKGSTYYGIAACVTVMCESIIFDQKQVLPLSSFIPEFGVCLSLPSVLGEQGIERIMPISLDDKEQERLQQSAQMLKKMIDQQL